MLFRAESTLFRDFHVINSAEPELKHLWIRADQPSMSLRRPPGIVWIYQVPKLYLPSWGKWISCKNLARSVQKYTSCNIFARQCKHCKNLARSFQATQCLESWFSRQENSWILSIFCENLGNYFWQDMPDFASLFKIAERNPRFSRILARKPKEESCYICIIFLLSLKMWANESKHNNNTHAWSESREDYDYSKLESTENPFWGLNYCKW